MKLVAEEVESEALKAYLRAWPSYTSSALLRVEGLRAARKAGPEAVASARSWFRSMTLVPITDMVLNEAAMIGPDLLRSLDAIHLASALQLGSDLGVVITYDRRLADAACEIGIEVTAPA